MADETMGARCRNCGNTGISPWTGEPCGCKHGKALAHLAPAQPAGETTKECACGECDTVTWCSLEPLYVGSYVVSHIWLCNVCVVKLAQERKQQQTSEPRAIIRHFAAAMEAKLAANDATKGGWTDMDWIDHYCALLAEIGELVAALSVLEDYRRHGVVEDEARQAVLDEAADCSNYLAMIADVVGALPPTDERGR